MARIIARTKVKPPAAPTVTALSTTSLQATFAAPAGFSVASYLPEFSLDSATWTSLSASATGSVTKTGLNPGSLGYFRARAVDGAGNSSVVSAVGSGTTLGGLPFQFNYPILGTYYLSPTQWGNNTIRDWIGARFANVVFTKWNGAEATAGLSCKAAMDDMLANAPASMGATPVYTIYILNNEVTKNTGDSATTFVRTRCAAQNQYLYSGVVGGSIVDSNYDPPNNYAINNTSGGLAGSDGKTFIQWYIETKYTHNVVGDGSNSANSTVHGHYLDNIFWIPRTGTANYDATGSSNETAAAAASSQRTGLANHYSYEATVWPTARVRLGNVDDLSAANIATLYNDSFTPDLSAISPLSQVIDGGVGGEYWLGSSFSKEFQERNDVNPAKSWNVLRNHAYFTDSSVRYPQLLIYSSREITTAATTSNWQLFRFGFGACLAVTQGGFDDTLAATTTWDPDEYTNAGAGIGWLGPAIDPPRYNSYQIAQGPVGVVVRRFTNGYVVVNPRNNGSQTITLPYDGTRITARSGKSDPAVNTGAAVTGGVSTWSAQDRDAIVITYASAPVLPPDVQVRVLATKEIDNNTAANPAVTLSGGNIPVNGRDLLVCIAAYYGSDDSPTSITDDRGTGNVYTKIDTGDAVTGGAITNKATVYLCKGYTGTNAPTIMINQGARTGEYVTWCVLEVTGLTASPVDTNARGTQRGVGGSSGAVAAATPTTQAINLVLTVASYEYGVPGANVTVPSGYTAVFTEGDGSANQSGGVAYRITNAISTPTATWTWAAGPYPWHCVLVTLKVA